jgi:hypothetical protein
MRITDQALDEFMELYKEEFGEELGRSEASEMAFRFVTLYEALATRLPDDRQAAMPPDEPPHQAIGFQI